jgi:RimJ/RimL family protein N-acetyltransferase
MHARLIPNFPDVTVRPIRATDKDALLDLFTRMSDRSRTRRFLSPKPRLSARELAYFTEVDHRTHEALVALTADGTFVGVGRYACGTGQTEVADVAFAVADAWQGRGIGTALAVLIVERARLNGIGRLQATTLPENGPSRKLLARMGFGVCGISAGALDVDLDRTAVERRGAALRRAA